jgi:AcrR family transcriptional regulator
VRRRNPQQVRSEVMQEKLIAATLDALLDCGFTRMSTTKIAESAGVSRGALTYHYPAKEDLVTASFSRLLVDGISRINNMSDEVRAKNLTFEAFIDELWAMFSGPFQMISLEMIVECRHNKELRDKLIPFVEQFHAEIDRIWMTFFNRSGTSPEEVGITMNLTTCLFRGMGIQTVLLSDKKYFSDLLQAWKANLLSADVTAQLGS